MDDTRRGFIQCAGLALCLGAPWADAFAQVAGASAPTQDWAQGVFAARNVREAVRALGGAAMVETQEVSWGNTPDIAENGMVVPIAISTTLPKVESIGILIEKNPNPMAALYEVLPGTDPSFRANFKLGESSFVYALIKQEGKVLVARHEIKVTIGGCGG